MIFHLEKFWEFQAESLEEAREKIKRLEIFTPDDIIEAGERLEMLTESLNKHWEKEES